MEQDQQQMVNGLPRGVFPKVRMLRLMNFSLRPLHLQMTFYLFLFRPHLSGRSYRLKVEFSSVRWHVSFERPKQNELLHLVKRRHTAMGPQGFRPATAAPAAGFNLKNNFGETEPEIEIIPLAPVWRQAA